MLGKYRARARELGWCWCIIGPEAKQTRELNAKYNKKPSWLQAVVKVSPKVVNLLLSAREADLPPFWTTFEDFGKTGLRVMSASSLVLSSLLSLLSTVHLPTRES